MTRLPILSPEARFPERRWYPIAFAATVRREPVAVRRLGRSLVLFRDDRRRVHALDARCPHRGADLAAGRVVDGTIECPYHGFRYAPDGACVRVPCATSDEGIRRDLRAQAFHVREAHGFVWLFHGYLEGESEASLPPLPWFDDLPDDERHSAQHEETWPIPAWLAMEGALDFHHVPFAHRTTLGWVGPRLDPYVVETDEHTVYTRGSLRGVGANPDFEGTLHGRLPGVLYIGLGARSHGFVAYTPIDESNTWIAARFYVEVPIVGRLLAHLALLFEFRLVQRDDRRMLASSVTDGAEDRAYKLVRADRGVLEWSRLYARACETHETR